jgi:hypothetical protein
LADGTSAVKINRFFRDSQRYRLTRPKPLIPGMAVHAIQFLGTIKHPCEVADCQAVNVEFFMS